MKRTPLSEYVSSPWAKPMFVAAAKEGKSVFLVAQALGVWPEQRIGGIVDRPEHLHIMTFDVKALKGVRSFLTKRCGASSDIGKADVINMEDEVRRVARTSTDWDYTFYNAVLTQVADVHARAKKTGGVHVLLVSSLTGLVQAAQRACFGRPGLSNKKGSGADMAKWAAISPQITEVRNMVQQDGLHAWWEGHITEVPVVGQQDETKDSIGLQGSAGKTFAYNVSEVFRLRRQPGARLATHPGVDRIFIDTAPNLSFFQGRDFHELAPKETDMTAVFKKLGYSVGRWGKRPVSVAVK